MPRPTFHAGLAAACLLAPLAGLCSPAPARENRGLAVDAAEISADLPQLFRGSALDVGPRAKLSAVEARNPCALSESLLCYNSADRHLVLRPARQYMPRLEGLTAENVSLRRNAIVFRYTFR